MIPFTKSKGYNESHTFLFLLYCIMGGAFFSNVEINSRIKHAYGLLTAGSLFVITIGGFCGYFLTSTSLNTPNIAHVLTFFNAILYCVVFVPVVTLYFRHELETVMYYTSCKYSNENRFSISNFSNKRKINVKTIGLTIFVIQTSMAGVYILLNVVILFIFGNDKFTKDVKNYLGPVPFVERVNSRRTYLIILTMQAMLEVPPIFIAGALASFTIMMGYGFYNSSIDLFSHTKKLMEAVRSIENMYDESNLYSNRPEIMTQNQQMALVDVLKQVREHQEFVRMIKLFLPYLETFSSVQFIAFLVAQLPNVYLLLLANPPGYIIFRQIFYLSMPNICLFATCYVGKLLDEMNEDWRNEIYSLPWYNMPLQYRKLVYIFLCQVHKPLDLYAFKTSKVNLYSFVQAWKLMYSVINILRVTLHPK